MDFAQIKKYCASKDTIKKVKRYLTEWDKIFANHVSDKGFIPKTYKEFLQLINKKKNNLIFKRAKDLNKQIKKMQ